MIKNPCCNAGDVGSIPGWGTKIPHGATNRHATTTEPTCSGACVTQIEKPVHRKKEKKGKNLLCLCFSVMRNAKTLPRGGWDCPPLCPDEAHPKEANSSEFCP